MPTPQAAEVTGGGVNCLDDTFTLVREELLAQEKEIQDLQAQIALLEKTSSKVIREVVVVQDVADAYKVPVAEEEVEVKGRRRSVREASDDHKIHVAMYEFDQSMWDAGLLLCFHHTGFVDKVLLFIGVVLNLVLQLAMLLVVEFAMLDSPWTPDQVAEMLKWRVNTGHKTFFEDTGQSLAQRLCSRQLWNFEQEVYNEVYDYLSKPIPGVLLSLLACSLWILTIMMEYRSCVEQALGVWHLPSLRSADEFEEVTEDGEIMVRGISPCLRFVAFVMLILPRLFIMSALAVVGSVYVAQTASLADIVLNCLALAFVLDVDELVANVLLTEKLRGLLTKIQPITCGMTKSVRAPFQDVLRLLLTGGGIIAAVFVVLLPFKGNVEAAAAVLCGGNLNFSYTGGVPTDPSIVLRPTIFGTDFWTPTCPETAELFYLQKYYLPDLNSTTARSNATTIRSSAYWENKQMQNVWDFVLHPETSSCPVGQILAPTREDKPGRECMAFPEALLLGLDDNKVKDPGRNALVSSCPRFSPTSGCSASATLPEACHWTWMSQRCDEDAPGFLHSEACDSEWFIQCETWRWFNVTHPTINCQIYDICGTDSLCGVMTGDLTLNFPDLELALSNVSAILTSTRDALANLTSTTSDKVTVTQAEGRRLQNSTNSSNSSFLKLKYEIVELPVTVFPNQVVQQSDALISKINTGLKATNITVTSAQFQAPQTITNTQLWDQKYGGDGPGYGGGGPGYGDDGGGFGDGGDTGDDGGNPDGGDTGDDGGNPDGGDTGDDGGNPDGGDTGDDGGNPDGGDTGDDGGNPDGGDTGDDGGNPDGGDTGDDGGGGGGGGNHSSNTTSGGNGDDGGGDTGDDGGNPDGGDTGDDGGNSDGGDTGDDGGNSDGGDTGDDGGNPDGGTTNGSNTTSGGNGDDGGNPDSGNTSGGNSSNTTSGGTGDDGGNSDGGDTGDDDGNSDGGDNGDDGGNPDGGNTSGNNSSNTTSGGNGDDGGNPDGGNTSANSSNTTSGGNGDDGDPDGGDAGDGGDPDGGDAGDGGDPDGGDAGDGGDPDGADDGGDPE